MTRCATSWPHRGCDRPHRCQAGVLWLDSPPSQAAEEIRAKIAPTKASLDTATEEEQLAGLRRLEELNQKLKRLKELKEKEDEQRRDRLPEVRWAEKELTKYPYSLLFSFLRLVKEPHEPKTLDDWVPAEQALEWCSRYGLPATEAQLYIAEMDCLRLDRFQIEAAILYWLFQLWKALKDWELFEESLGPIDSEQAENQRKAIHRYADLLLGLCQAPHRHVLASDVALASAIRAECEVRKALDRRLDPEVKASYEKAQEHVNIWAKTFFDALIRQRLGEWVELSWGPSGAVPRVRCVFGACYLQLEGLRQKPPGEWAWYLRRCAAPACGNLFGADTVAISTVSCILDKPLGWRRREQGANSPTWEKPGGMRATAGPSLVAGAGVAFQFTRRF